MSCGCANVIVGGPWFQAPTLLHFLARTLAEDSDVLWIQLASSIQPRRGTQPVAAIPVARRIRLTTVLRCANRSARRFAADLRRAARDDARVAGCRAASVWLRDPELISAVRSAGFGPVTLISAQMAAGNARPFFSSGEIAERPVPRGCVDFGHFSPTPWLPVEAIPAEIANLREPVLGYLGPIDSDLDIGLLGAAARLEPSWSFVLCGCISADVAPLRRCDNVFIIPSRPLSVLPAYLRAFHAAMLPLRPSAKEQPRSIFVREYLAAGLPIVGTPAPQNLSFDSAVHIGSTPAGFVLAAARALRMSRVYGRLSAQELVRDDDWSLRVRELLMPVAATSAAAF